MTGPAEQHQTQRRKELLLWISYAALVLFSLWALLHEGTPLEPEAGTQRDTSSQGTAAD